jgi:hypothetical protein
VSGGARPDLSSWQLAEALTEDVLPLSDSARRRHKKMSIPNDPPDGNEFHLTSLLVN